MKSGTLQKGINMLYTLLRLNQIRTPPTPEFREVIDQLTGSLQGEILSMSYIETI